MWKCEQRETKRISLDASPLSNISNHLSAAFQRINVPLNVLGNELTKSLLHFDDILSSRVSCAIPFNAVLLFSIKIDRRVIHIAQTVSNAICFAMKTIPYGFISSFVHALDGKQSAKYWGVECDVWMYHHIKMLPQTICWLKISQEHGTRLHIAIQSAHNGKQLFIYYEWKHFTSLTPPVYFWSFVSCDAKRFECWEPFFCGWIPSHIRLRKSVAG